MKSLGDSSFVFSFTCQLTKNGIDNVNAKITKREFIPE